MSRTPPNLSRLLGFAVRVLVSLTLVSLALAYVDIGAVEGVLAHVAWGWLAVALGLVAVIIYLESLQFAAVARAFDHALSTARSLRMTLIGRFFSLLTPAMLGSDVYRAVSMRSMGVGGGRSVGLSAASRVMSLMSLVPVLVAGLPFIAWNTNFEPRFWGFAAIVCLAATAWLPLVAPVERWLPERTPRALADLARGAEQLRFAALRSHVTGLLWSSAILQHVIRAFAVMATARAFGVGADWTVFFGFVPISLLIAMVPVSIGSWGVREVALVVGLGAGGVPADKALMTSIAFGLLGTLAALVGGGIWMTGAGGSRPGGDEA